MKTIGTILKEARLKKGLSRLDLENATKIKTEFISQIENGAWGSLPEFPVTLGFVKSMAGSVGVNVSQAAALLRRDFPPRKQALAPKPDVGKQWVWTPRLTFLAGIVIAILAIFAYLGFQYVKFASPPFLSVVEPREGQVVAARSLEVWGKTDPGATIKVNNQPVLVSETGEFKTEIAVLPESVTVEIRALSRAKKETVVVRNITVELGK